MSVLDLTEEGPLTLESLLLSKRIADERGDRPTLVLLTAEQQMDVYTEMQKAVRFAPPSGGDGVRWSGLTLQVKDAA